MRSTSFVSISFISAVFLLMALPVEAKSVQEIQKAKQKLNKELTAYPGEPVLTIKKKQNMPNIFGKADIWGRKIDKGSISVSLHGIDGYTVGFIIEDNTIHTNESTMSHTTMTWGRGSANADTEYYGNSASTRIYGSGSATTIGGQDIDMTLSSNQRLVMVETDKQPRLMVGDFKIVFVEVDNFLKYQILEATDESEPAVVRKPKAETVSSNVQALPVKLIARTYDVDQVGRGRIGALTIGTDGKAIGHTIDGCMINGWFSTPYEEGSKADFTVQVSQCAYPGKYEGQVQVDQISNRIVAVGSDGTYDFEWTLK